MTIESAKEYIKKIDSLSNEEKKLNYKAVRCAKELSAWLSIAEYGSDEFKKRALKVISSIQ